MPRTTLPRIALDLHARLRTLLACLSLVLCVAPALAALSEQPPKKPSHEPKWIAPARPTQTAPVPSWIWAASGKVLPTTANAAAGNALFVQCFLIPDDIKSARLSAAADNRATVLIDNEEILKVTSWSTPAHADITLAPGTHTILIDADNDAAPASSRNPGGVIARLELTLADGSKQWLVTDRDWMGINWDGEPSTADLFPDGTPRAIEIGPATIAPWSLSPSAFDAPAPCPMLRRTFTLDALPDPATASNPAAAASSAVVRIIGLGHYELRCNGKVVGDSVINQAWSQYNTAIYWQEFDLAPHLRVGENVLAVTLGNSFWRVDAPNDSGRFAKTDAMPDFSNGQPHLLWLDASITTPTSQVRIVSDESWTWTNSPLTFSHIYAGEDFDARLAQPGWDASNFVAPAASTWSPVAIVDAPAAELRPLTSPAMKAFEVFSPTEIKRPAPGIYTYVFPQNCSALLRFTLTGGKPGDRVRFRPCEYMDETGRVKFTYTWGTGKDIWHDYTKSSAASESHQTLFCFVGAQFVQVQGAVPEGDPNPDNLPVLTALEQVHVRAANAIVGNITTSSPIQNAAHALIDWAIRSNMAHVPMDCPHREKNGWIEQTWHMARSISYTYDINAWFSKTCADIRDTQQPDGHIPTNCPNYLVGVPPHGFWNNAPEWGIAGVLLPWHLYEWYGNTAALEASYDSAARYIDYLTSTAKDGIITSNLGDWYDFGHGKGNGPSQWTPNEVSATAIWALGAQTMARTASVLNREADRARFQSLYEQIRADFLRHFYDPTTKTVLNKGSCQAANAVALCAGLIPVNDRGQALNAIIADLESRAWKQTPGEVLQIFLIRALAESGRGDVLHRIYSRDDIPSYGHMVKSGLTTLPESWDARRGTGDSLNHFMLGHLMEWHYAFVGGIRQAPGSVGWERVLIMPQTPPLDLLASNPEAIRSCDASFQSPRGTITSSWRIDGDTFTLTCTIPDDVEAAAVLPDGTRQPLTRTTSHFTCSLKPRRN